MKVPMRVRGSLLQRGGGPKLSVVIPMLNEAPNVAPLLERLFRVLDDLGESFEVIAVDDGSTDATLESLRLECERSHGLRVISFARTFGQHAAIMAGFEAARGGWLITMDADLQNPPEEIPKLVQALREGHDLVHTYRQERQDPLVRKLASRLVNIFVRKASGISIRDFGCMLRGYHRRVVEPIVRRQEFHTFIPALASLHARRPVEIPVAHAARHGGRSAYSLWKLVSLQLDLVTSFSLVPLRLLLVVGTGVALCGMLLGLVLLVMRIVYGPEWAAQGVFTLFAVLFFLVGAQFVAFGVLGEYVGRVYHEVRVRPRYLIREATDVPKAERSGGGTANEDAETLRPARERLGGEHGGGEPGGGESVRP